MAVVNNSGTYYITNTGGPANNNGLAMFYNIRYMPIFPIFL